ERRGDRVRRLLVLSQAPLPLDGSRPARPDLSRRAKDRFQPRAPFLSSRAPPPRLEESPLRDRAEFTVFESKIQNPKSKIFLGSFPHPESRPGCDSAHGARIRRRRREDPAGVGEKSRRIARLADPEGGVAQTARLLRPRARPRSDSGPLPMAAGRSSG